MTSEKATANSKILSLAMNRGMKLDELGPICVDYRAKHVSVWE